MTAAATVSQELWNLGRALFQRAQEPNIPCGESLTSTRLKKYYSAAANIFYRHIFLFKRPKSSVLFFNWFRGILRTLDPGNIGSQAILRTPDPGNTESQAILRTHDPGNIGSQAILRTQDPGNIGSQAILRTQDPENTGNVLVQVCT